MNEIENMVPVMVSHGIDVENIRSCSLNLLYMNTRSCRYKLDLIEAFVQSLNKPIHVIIFTETWLYTGEIFNINGCQSFHSTRDGERGGGVSIFVKDMISAHTLFSGQLDISNFLVVELPEYLLKLVAIYNPGRNVSQFLSHIEETIAHFKSCIVFGDFNINLLNEDPLTLDYRAVVEGNGYVFLNSVNQSFATRVSNTIETIIDHVFTDLCKYSYNFTLLENDTDLSDHKSIVLSVNQVPVKPIKSNTKTVLQYELLNSNDLDVNHVSNFDDFVDHYRNIIRSNTKTVRTTRKGQPKRPYINGEVLQLINIKRNLYHAYKRNPALEPEYRRARNDVTNKIKHLKKSYYENQINSSIDSPRKMWSHINELVFNKQKSATLHSYVLDINGTLTTDESIISNAFNDYFVNVCDSILPEWGEQAEPEPEINNNSNNIAFSFVTVSDDQIMKCINDLNRNSATGIDGISVKFFQKYANIFISKYRELINNCIELCQFPNCLKTAKVVPIYKSGSKTKLNNYRPVSVLNVASKPIEKILHQQIQNYCTQYNIVHQSQFGFVPFSNTMTAVAHLVNYISIGLDDGKKVACVFVDIRKAFDSVHHGLLVKKLHKVGFSENAKQLIMSYLDRRTQIVKINNTHSVPKLIKHGVPQGSILGPLLFLIYINDIFQLPLKGKLQLYADDASLVYCANELGTLEEHIIHDLKLLTCFFTSNHMAINLEKTNFIVFSLRGESPRLSISVENTIVNQISCGKYLGILIDENLKWNMQVNSICSKIIPYMFALKKIRCFIAEKTAWNIYYAYIQPHLIYMNSIWGVSSAVHLRSLTVLQNKSIKIIKQLPPLHPTRDLYDKKVLPLQILNKYETCIYMFKTINRLIKSNFELIYISEIHDHNTRGSANRSLFALRYRTRISKNCVINQGIILFNSLPPAIRNITSLNEFKSVIRQYLWQNFSNNQPNFSQTQHTSTYSLR